MEQSSFLTESSKSKKRKPIFGKNQHSPVAKLDQTLSKNSSHLHLAHRNPSQPHSQQASRVIPYPLELHRPQSHLNIASQAQPAHSQHKAPSPHVIYQQRPQTPIVIRSATQQVLVPNLQQSLARPLQVIHTVVPHNAQPTPIRSTTHTSQRFYQTQPVTFERRVSDYKENVGSDVEVKPSLVAIERVMKEVGSNVCEKEITYFPKGHQQPNRAKESRISKYQPSSSPDDKEMSKLAEINSLLSQNYNLLYNQFYSLKKEIREEQVVEEQAFLKRSINQIESIFERQTHQALSQMHELSQRRLKKVGRGRADPRALFI